MPSQTFTTCLGTSSSDEHGHLVRVSTPTTATGDEHVHDQGPVGPVDLDLARAADRRDRLGQLGHPWVVGLGGVRDADV